MRRKDTKLYPASTTASRQQKHTIPAEKAKPNVDDHNSSLAQDLSQLLSEVTHKSLAANLKLTFLLFQVQVGEARSTTSLLSRLAGTRGKRSCDRGSFLLGGTHLRSWWSGQGAIPNITVRTDPASSDLDDIQLADWNIDSLQTQLYCAKT